jgi:adenine-specific DNA-methyltransferase
MLRILKIEKRSSLMSKKMKFETKNLAAENISKHAELFPEVFAEGNVNIDLLRSKLGQEVFGDEAYEFTWVGKREAIAEIGRPTRKTLRPCPEESRSWDNTENLYIEGDNLEVLKLLQESYLGKVKMIYIDPPYNTGNDFIYRDNFTQSKEEYEDETGEYDEDGDRLYRNSESNGRFHSDWCSMIYPRLVLARNLLSNDGVIFISIDDNEAAQLRKICDEVFGEENFVAQIIWKNKFGSGAMTAGFIGVHEYIIAYSKTPIKNITRTLTDGERENYNKTRDSKFAMRGGYVTQPLAVTTFGDRPNLRYPVHYNGQKIWPNKQWVWEKSRLLEAIKNDEVVFNLQKDGSYNLRSKKYLLDENGNERRGKPTTFYTDVYTQNGTQDIRNIFENIVFDYSKPIELVKYLIGLEINDTPSKDDLILDFFSGSAATAHAVMQLNAEDGGRRKFIMVQIPEVCDEKSEAFKAGFKNICEIGKERIRRAGDKLADSAKNTNHSLSTDHYPLITKLDTGFRVLKLSDSNMKDVYFTPSEYTQDMLKDMVSNIKEDRTDLDLLFGCLIEWGLPLSLPHTHENIDGFTVHTYNKGDLIACFDERISEKAIREIASRKPLRVVFRDSSFTNSPDKINAFEIFKLIAPNTKVRVI